MLRCTMGVCHGWRGPVHTFCGYLRALWCEMWRFSGIYVRLDTGFGVNRATMINKINGITPISAEPRKNHA